MKIYRVLKNVRNNLEIINNHKVSNISINSKDIEKNCVFIAINGNSVDGHNFINEAINNGAKTILYQNEITKYVEGINYVKVENNKKALGIVCKNFYKDISSRMNIVGITGTNGKTTTSTLIHDFYGFMGIKSTLIGTEGVFINDVKYSTLNTTPDILTIYKILSDSYYIGINKVIMEVSSIAIKELRVYGLNFDIIGYTNLTHDHLDYHKSFTDYLYSKGRFLASFSNSNTKFILNKDDKYFDIMYEMSGVNTYTYSYRTNSDYEILNVDYHNFDAMDFVLLINGKYVNIHTKFLGLFNAYNITLFIAIILNLNYKMRDIKRFIKYMRYIPGRLERININNKNFIIDYAHTPTGVEEVLKNIRQFTNTKILTIIGCGGNRDVPKRPIIGEIVTRLSDYVILTNDNPRFEDEISIIHDIEQGINTSNYKVIVDREEAIRDAVLNYSDTHLIVILGKGNESYQIINDKHLEFNDKKIVYKIIEEL